MEKIVNRMINDAVEGVDTYKTDGSTWLIFTETKKWVIELTKDGTLWYNYNFFKDLLAYLSMDVVENQHYITKWVENNVINKVKRTLDLELRNQINVEYTIQNGVKHTKTNSSVRPHRVEDTIQNGVKRTENVLCQRPQWVEETKKRRLCPSPLVEDTIQNGVKETLNTDYMPQEMVEETIENGVKETIDLEMDDEEVVEYFIENGVKETTPSGYLGSIEMKGKIVHQFESPKQNNEVEDTIQNGVKKTKRSYESSRRRRTKDTIQNGVKETKIGAPDNRDYFIKDTIENGVKLTNSSLQIDGSCVIEDVIKEGVKYTGGIGNPNWMGNKVETAIENGVKQTFKIQWPMEVVEETIQKGIKNTYSDILPKEYDWSDQFDVQEVIDNGVKHTEYGDWEDGDERLDDIIRNGVKETLSSVYPIERVVEKVVEVGVLETKSMDEWVNTDYIVNKVMDNGIKEVQPLPAQDGNRDWGNYYYRKGEPTKPHTKYVDDVLEKGEKI